MSFIIKAYKSFKLNKERRVYPQNILILHQFPRSLRAPSNSPFCLKLETWLRMANIPYQNNFSYLTSPKDKMPWISLITKDIDIDMGDSQHCIDFVSNRYNLNLNSHLTAKELAISRAFVKLTEESLYWILLLHRYIYSRNYEESGVPNSLSYFYSSTVAKGSLYQGYGRHTKEEVYEIAKRDIKSIDDFIGNNKYLMGDRVCDADASIFGMMCQFLYHTYGPICNYINDECPNILRYVETMKQEFWKDWSENITEKLKIK